MTARYVWVQNQSTALGSCDPSVFRIRIKQLVVFIQTKVYVACTQTKFIESLLMRTDIKVQKKTDFWNIKDFLQYKSVKECNKLNPWEEMSENGSENVSKFWWSTRSDTEITLLTWMSNEFFDFRNFVLSWCQILYFLGVIFWHFLTFLPITLIKKLFQSSLKFTYWSIWVHNWSNEPLI